MSTGKSLYDLVASIANKLDSITYDEFCHMIHGTEEERREAVERMLMAGGYENLL